MDCLALVAPKLDGLVKEQLSRKGKYITVTFGGGRSIDPPLGGYLKTDMWS